MTGLLYFFFFCSGASGLIYQVVWVRVFGNVFGNTIYSTALVVAVFMLGLGAGSYVVGNWSDRRYAELGLDRESPSPRKRSERDDRWRRSQFLLRAYGFFELAIAVIGLGISALLPHLGQLSAAVSTYSREANGWYALSTTSYLARAATAVLLLTPITLLMGGTLTLLIRHLVRRDVEASGWRIAILYAVNTAGAAAGCFLTDFALVPLSGLRGAQWVAILFNIVAGAGALFLSYVASGVRSYVTHNRKPDATITDVDATRLTAPVALISLALAMCGFAAMGMEILWFRHFTVLLGALRAVFSLLLTVILIGIGAGAFVSGLLIHRSRRRPAAPPARTLMFVQGLFVAFTLLGLAGADAGGLERVVRADPAYQEAAGRAVDAAPAVRTGVARTFTELWFNARPILLEVAIPALLMGFSFPVANAIVQRAERSVGRHAGVLYLSNTVGAVCGSLAAGFLLLPMLGIQSTATVLMVVAALAAAPLFIVDRRDHHLVFARAADVAEATVVSSKGAPARVRGANVPLALSLTISGTALGLWYRLPPDYVLDRALGPTENVRLLTRSEGLTEIVSVTEVPGRGRLLLTNGHPMSATMPLSQRYMRALAHLPLLSIDNPETVLVIGFGVGNTAHAASLHPSVRRIDVADLSRNILAHSSYFSAVNRDVLNDPRVAVYVNDGRHHLQMQPPASYDLITLEPPPIGYAGVAALYSRDFYSLARTRLAPRGYISQWLPAYQVPAATTLAMIRAFLDVFPQAVLISGAEADLLMMGANDVRIEVDPGRLAAALSRSPAVEADLKRLDLGSIREIVGAFVGSARTLVQATRDSIPVSDDRPIQEYGVRSLLDFGDAVPPSVVDLTRVAEWCPACFAGGRPVPLVAGLDTYLALLERAYRASPAEMSRTRTLADRQPRLVSGSAYLGAIVPESADLHNVLGIAHADRGRFDEAIAEFRQALRLEPDSGKTCWHLGAALASSGARQEAIGYLRRSVQLDPGNGLARYDLGSILLVARQLDEAAEQFRAAVRLMPDSVEAHNSLGLALAFQGKLADAIEEFQRALSIDPQFAEAARNLTIARRQYRDFAKNRTP